MESGIDKCTMLVTKKEQIVNSEGTKRKNTLIEITKRSYRYRGVLESDGVLSIQLKANVEEFIRRVKKLTKSNLG